MEARPSQSMPSKPSELGKRKIDDEEKKDKGKRMEVQNENSKLTQELDVMIEPGGDNAPGIRQE